MHQSQVHEAETLDNDDHDEWAERCRYWLGEYEASIPKRKRRERQAHPLILTGNGISMRVDRGALVIRDGLTHYPQDIKEHRFFPGGLENPPRIVLVDGNGQITLDAIDWLAEQNIPLIRLKRNGAFASIITSGGQAADPDKVRWQSETRYNSAARAQFAVGLLKRKARNTLDTLEGWVPHSRFWDKSRESILTGLSRLVNDPPDHLSDVLGIEGAIATAYFRAWQGVEIRWKATSRHPIPDDWREYRSRTALRDEKPQNRHATHPVNAMLNYVYGMLAARKQIEAVAEGYDPMLGIVHDRRKTARGKTPAYALDIMEPDRPIVDRNVLGLLREDHLRPSDFALSSKGVCRVGPELARQMINALHSVGV